MLYLPIISFVKHGLVILLLFAGVSLSSDANAETAPAVGMTEAELIEAVGEPAGRMKAGSRVYLSYKGGVVEVENGKVVDVPKGFKARAEKFDAQQAAQKSFADQKREEGLVNVGGKWVTPEQRDALKQKKTKPTHKKTVTQKQQPPASKILDSNGKEVDHSALLARGKITIVYYRRFIHMKFKDGVTGISNKFTVFQVNCTFWC